MARWLLLAMLVGCDDGPVRGDASVHIDAPAISPSSVTCGTTTCPTPMQACCDLSPPSTDFCYPVTGVCEGGRPIRCDGSEDCGTGNVCCAFGGGSFVDCTTAASCQMEGGLVMCHGTDTPPCAGADRCCPLSADSTYSVCKPTC